MDVAKLECCTCFSGVLQVFLTYVASVLAVFGRMLQVFYLDVAKVDLVLHIFF
jgi:hypothetical protein